MLFSGNSALYGWPERNTKKVALKLTYDIIFLDSIVRDSLQRVSFSILPDTSDNLGPCKG